MNPKSRRSYLGWDKWACRSSDKITQNQSRGEGKRRRKDLRSPARTQDQPMRSFQRLSVRNGW